MFNDGKDAGSSGTKKQFAKQMFDRKTRPRGLAKLMQRLF